MNAIPVGSRCFGKRGRLPTHNLITHGVEFCSAYVSSRLLAARGRRVSVSVDPAGSMMVYPAWDKRMRDKPVEWLVGVYGKSATLRHIADDLEIRASELSGSDRGLRDVK